MAKHAAIEPEYPGPQMGRVVDPWRLHVELVATMGLGDISVEGVERRRDFGDGPGRHVSVLHANRYVKDGQGRHRVNEAGDGLLTERVRITITTVIEPVLEPVVEPVVDVSPSDDVSTNDV